jgi:hypothetical protein
MAGLFRHSGLHPQILRRENTCCLLRHLAVIKELSKVSGRLLMPLTFSKVHFSNRFFGRVSAFDHDNFL